MTDQAPRQINWDGIQAEYRAGNKSNVVLAASYGLSEAAIRKRAKRDGWQRDLSAAVKEATKEALVMDAVRRVRADDQARSDQDIIDAAAEESAGIVRRHRRDIGRLADTVRVLGEQLADAAESRERLIEIIKATSSPKAPKAAEAMRRAVSLPTHATVARDLTTAAKTLISLERQAFDLGGSEVDAGIESWLKKLEDAA